MAKSFRNKSPVDCSIKALIAFDLPQTQVTGLEHHYYMFGQQLRKIKKEISISIMMQNISSSIIRSPYFGNFMLLKLGLNVE